MGLESRFLSKGSMAMAGSSNNRKRPFGVLLLLALGSALLSVAVLHKLRERRVLSLLVLDQERDLLALQVLLQKERERNKRTRSRLEDSRDEILSLTQHKKELHSKLMETETTLADLKRLQKEMEATLEEKENRIKRMTEEASESAEENQQVSVLTQLLKQKEAEIERMRKQPSEAQQSEDIKATPGNADNSEDEGAAHEVSSRNEAWVKLETIVEDEGGRDDSGSQESREKIEVSEGSEEAGKQEGEGPEIEELQGAESTSREMAEKEESAAEDGDSKELENSQVLLHEEKTGSESVDSTTIERPKMRHRRRRGTRTKAKSRRRPESEKQDQETADSRRVNADGKEELVADNAVHEESLETTTAIPQENEGSETTEIKAGTKKEDGKAESEHEASKLEVRPEGSISGGNPQLPETGDEPEAEEEEVILPNEKPADSARSGGDDESEESNDHNLGKIQQEETATAI